MDALLWRRCSDLQGRVSDCGRWKQAKSGKGGGQSLRFVAARAKPWPVCVAAPRLRLALLPRAPRARVRQFSFFVRHRVSRRTAGALLSSSKHQATQLDASATASAAALHTTWRPRFCRGTARSERVRPSTLVPRHRLACLAPRREAERPLCISGSAAPLLSGRALAPRRLVKSS